MRWVYPVREAHAEIVGESAVKLRESREPRH